MHSMLTVPFIQSFLSCVACRQEAASLWSGICGPCSRALLRAPGLCVNCFSTACLCLAKAGNEIQAVRAVFLWDGRSHDLFKRWKKTRGLLLERVLFDLENWNPALADFPRRSTVVPIPQFYKRSYRLMRSPAGSIAQRVAQVTHSTVLPLIEASPHLNLPSTLHSKSMAQQSLESRLRVPQRYHWRHVVKPIVEPPESVILVDDAITSGKTARDAVRALIQGGVKRVWIFALGYRVRAISESALV